MAFTPHRSELATEFKKRIAVAETSDLIAVVPHMQKHVHFAAQLPFLLEELQRRGHPVREIDKNPHALTRIFILILAGIALATLFFGGDILLRDAIHDDLSTLRATSVKVWEEAL
jgi:hypothetical protein